VVRQGKANVKRGAARCKKWVRAGFVAERLSALRKVASGTRKASDANKARTEGLHLHTSRAVKQETTGDAELFRRTAVKTGLCTVRASGGRKCAKFLRPSVRRKDAMR